MKRKLCTGILSLSLLAIPSVAMAQGTIGVTVDGNTLTMDVAPVNQDGRILTPFRAIAESLGATVTYDGASKKVTATKGSTVISFIIGQKTITVNGQENPLDVAPVIVGDRVLLPARAYSEGLGANVEWFNNTVLIGTNPAAAQALLLETTKANAELQSYKADGTLEMQTTVPGSPTPINTNANFTASYQKPFQIYLTMNMKMNMAGQPSQDVQTEMCMKDGKTYIKMSGETAKQAGLPDQWMDTGAVLPPELQKTIETMSDPQAAESNIKSLGINAVSGGEKTINGKTYKVLYVTTPNNIQPILQQLNSSANLPTDALKNTTMNFQYVYYIDPQTKLAEIIDVNGDMSMTVEGKTANFKIAEHLVLKDINQPITFPDVSKAVPMPQAPAPAPAPASAQTK